MGKEQSTSKEARAANEVPRFEDTIPTSAANEPYIVDRDGKPVGVILPFEQYQKMKADLHDLAVVAERREETPISLDELERRLIEDGHL